MSLSFFELSESVGEVYTDDQSTVRVWDGALSDSVSGVTHYGIVTDGASRLVTGVGEFDLQAGMYFCVPGSLRLEGSGSGVLMTRHNCMGLFQIGGPTERIGRLRYIDGCSDTLLLPPVVCGDPCLNLLHIPANTQQTSHTHPSLRAGAILSGDGWCRTPLGSTDLRAGLGFVIPAEAEHSFHTGESDLLVAAWHPDSDTGPTHDDHPMVNRTIVNGVPASQIPEIRT